MKKLVQVFLLISACVGVSYGQEYKAGSIQLTNGEQRSGLLKVSNFKSLAKAVAFKTDPTSADSVIYTTDQLQGFQYDNQQFVRHDFGQPTGQRFLLVLNKGKYSLYQDYTGFYVKDRDSTQLMPLVKKEERRFRGQLMTMDLFKYQLDSLFRACPSMAGRAMRASYEERELSQLIGRLNTCLGDTAAANYTATLPKAIRSFGVRVLGGIGNLRYISYPNNASASGNIFGLGVFYSSMGGTVGKGRMGVQVGMDIAKFNFGETINYNPLFLQTSALFQYALGATNGKSYPFAEAGLQVGIQLNGNESLKVLGESSGDLGLSLPVGLGIKGKLTAKNNYVLSARFYRRTSPFGNRTSGICFSAGITF